MDRGASVQFSGSVLSDSFVTTMDCRPQGNFCLWDFPGKNTRVGCHFLFQGIFLTQGSSLGLLQYRHILYSLNHQGSPWKNGKKLLTTFEILVIAVKELRKSVAAEKL